MIIEPLSKSCLGFLSGRKRGSNSDDLTTPETGSKTMSPVRFYPQIAEPTRTGSPHFSFGRRGCPKLLGHPSVVWPHALARLLESRLLLRDPFGEVQREAKRKPTIQIQTHNLALSTSALFVALPCQGGPFGTKVEGSLGSLRKIGP